MCACPAALSWLLKTPPLCRPPLVLCPPCTPKRRPFPAPQTSARTLVSLRFDLVHPTQAAHMLVYSGAAPFFRSLHCAHRERAPSFFPESNLAQFDISISRGMLCAIDCAPPPITCNSYMTIQHRGIQNEQEPLLQAILYCQQPAQPACCNDPQAESRAEERGAFPMLRSVGKAACSGEKSLLESGRREAEELRGPSALHDSGQACTRRPLIWHADWGSWRSQLPGGICAPNVGG